MISYRFPGRTHGFCKMLSQRSIPWIPPAIIGEFSVFLENPSCDLVKKRPIYNKIVPSSTFLKIRKNPPLNLGKDQFFSGSGGAKLFNLKEYLPFNMEKRYFSYSTSAAQVMKPSNVRNWLNLRRKHSLSGIRTAHSDAYFSDMDENPSPNSRISRIARTEAQNALFDYLHCTRSLHFTDAEHMSKNSPVFLHNLLSKFDNEQDIGHSLTRFLRYHPINEFEPFFESLGLKPTELYPLLPRHLMFLTDDDILLENYHVLCNYGIPRSNIGKMYKEATEIFRYNYGVLSLKLQGYERLGLSTPTIVKLVTCCPSLLIGEIDMDFLLVLDKLKGLGFERDWIRGCLSDKSTYNWKRILEMMNFLEGMDCNKEDLGSLISQHPRFVFYDSGRKIYVLVALLLKLGLKMNTIMVLFVQYPQILVGNFTKNLWNGVHFLSEIGMEREDIAWIVSTHPHILGSCSLKKPKVVLSNLNVSGERLCEIIKEDPHQLSNLASRAKINLLELAEKDGSYLQEKTIFLMKLGYVENSDELAKALSKFRGRGDQLQERFDCLVHAGLDCHAVSCMIKLVPPVLNQSTDVIEKKIDYLLNHLGYPLESLVAFPAFLCYNMEKIKLRFAMQHWLFENGVKRSTKNRKGRYKSVALSTVLACSDVRFEKYFVNLHPQGPEVWKRLKNPSSVS